MESVISTGNINSGLARVQTVALWRLDRNICLCSPRVTLTQSRQSIHSTFSSYWPQQILSSGLMHSVRATQCGLRLDMFQMARSHVGPCVTPAMILNALIREHVRS